MSNLPSYEDLDLNQKINLKGAVADWTRYAVERFQASIDRSVGGERLSKRGVASYSLGTGYRFGMGGKLNKSSGGYQRTNNLRNHWWQRVAGGEGTPHVLIEFLLYGRFVDMGVGKGVDQVDHVTNRRLRLGSPGRTPRRWYAKKKTHQLHRLREILAERYVSVPLDLLENALTLTLPIPL